VPNSGKVYDRCGICGGDGELCTLKYELSVSTQSFCVGLDVVVQWVAPINHSATDSVAVYSKTNDTVIDQYAFFFVFLALYLASPRLLFLFSQAVQVLSSAVAVPGHHYSLVRQIKTVW
jgi:hypothetical protein